MASTPEKLKEARKKALLSPRIGKHGKAKTTLAKEEALRMFNQRIIDTSMKVINSALVKATGVYYVYKKHKKFKDYIKQVEDPKEIELALNEYFNDVESPKDNPHYYVVVAKDGDVKAMALVMDRTFGKPTEHKSLTVRRGMGDLLDELEAEDE